MNFKYSFSCSFMKVLKKDFKNNVLEILPQSLEDLWHLEKIIQKGDLLKASTERKIKLEHESFKQKMFLEIEVLKAEFAPYEEALRVLGIIKEGKPKEFLEIGAEHTISITVGKKFTLQKQKITNYILQLLDKYAKPKSREKCLAIILDDESALIALISEFKVEELMLISSGKSGKMQPQEYESKYFREILDAVKRRPEEMVVICGPGFIKEKLKNFFTENKLNKKIFVQNLHHTGKTGLSELMRRGFTAKILKEYEIVKETAIVGKFFEELSKDGKVAIAKEEVKKAISYGAVSELIVLEDLLKEEEIEKMLEDAEKQGAKIQIISEKHEAGKRLKAVGGIVALLRFKLTGI